MVIAHMQLSASQIMVIPLKSEDEVRYLILFQKEKLLHEDVSDMELFMIPEKFRSLPDCERRGFIRGLRWVCDDLDEDYK